MIIKRLPKVREFMQAGQKHLEASALLLRGCPEHSASQMSGEVIYLSGYVVECCLKALLLSQIPSEKHDAMIEDFKKAKLYGHDLEKYRREVQRQMGTFSTIRRIQVGIVRSKWTSEMRYSSKRYDRKEAEFVFEAAREIYHWTQGVPV